MNTKTRQGTRAVWAGEEEYLLGATQVPVVFSAAFGYGDMEEWLEVARGGSRWITANSDPAEVAAACAALVQLDPGEFKDIRDPNNGPAAIAKLEALSKFIDDLAKVDPQGKSLERIDAGTFAERKEAARIIGGVLGNLPTAALPMGNATTSTVSAAPSKPLFCLERVLASIRREIGGSASKAAAPLPGPKRCQR